MKSDRAAWVNRAVVRLKEAAVIPNKDFLLRYDVAGRKIEDAVLAHTRLKGGFFTLDPPAARARERH